MFLLLLFYWVCSCYNDYDLSFPSFLWNNSETTTKTTTMTIATAITIVAIVAVIAIVSLTIMHYTMLLLPVSFPGFLTVFERALRFCLLGPSRTFLVPFIGIIWPLIVGT